VTDSDREFLPAFEAATIPNAAFRHHDHLRMAWLYLRRDGATLGAARVHAGLRRFAAARGVAHAYHETLTAFWTRLMAHAVETLDSPVARREWVEPDLRPLP
jgi:hypothetical protein